MILNNFEKEVNSFSSYFRKFFYILFFVYLGFWLFTIHLSNIQKEQNLEPVLPVAPQDSEEYHNLAESIINKHEFAQNGATDTLRAPGYPAFAALFKYISGTYFAVTLVQIILVFLSSIIIRRLGMIFYSQKAGEIAAIVFLLNPLILTLSLVILTDILFLFLFLTGLYLALKNKILLPSLLFAAAIYTRPMGVFALPIFIVPFLFVNSSWKQKIKSSILMIVIILIAVMPWVYRNYKLTGVADFTSFKGINLAGFALPVYLANQNHTDIVSERAKIAQEMGIPQTKWDNLEYSNALANYAEKIILEHPLSYLKFHIISSLPFLFSSSLQDAVVTYEHAMHLPSVNGQGAISYFVNREWKLFFQSIVQVWWKIGERLIWLFIYIIALFGFWKNRRNPLAYAFIFIPAYLMLLAGPSANARYAIQALPFILIFFGTGIINLWPIKIKKSA